ncbi:MAG: hypothetical protein M1834_003465 [Cirrosporium novae-zelandiae]|nr:MAG: hypothetical protein M1834_003465 [Cirrosporium novae-zelandiae]
MARATLGEPTSVRSAQSAHGDQSDPEKYFGSGKLAWLNCRARQVAWVREELPKKTIGTEARQTMLSQILLPDAADRLGRIRMVKESRAIDIENRLIMMARTGQLRQKVTEDQLKQLLNAVADHQEEAKIVISRRKGGWDDDDDDLLDL